jgi:carbon monoxide dehydrogenase subunit G
MIGVARSDGRRTLEGTMPRCEPVGLDFILTAPVVARVEVTVKASPAQVWQVLNETERWPEWFEGMSKARVTSSEWNGVGSTRSVRVGPLGVDEKMIVWEPESRWGFCATALSWTGWIAKSMLETIDIEPAGDGSRLRYTGALVPVPWLKPLGGMLRKRLTSAWQTSLPNIDAQIA